jgi:DNA-binding NtrC family response regulator
MLRAKPLILCVDDEPDICEMLKDFLEDSDNFQVITCSDTSQVLPLIQRESPDLVTLDMNMPGKTGIELLEEIRAHDKDISIIMVTANRDIQTVLHAVRLGAYDYIIKPLSIDEVVFAKNRATDHRRLTLENRFYQQNLERMVEEKTSHLEQKIRELSALNSLFQAHLKQRTDAESNKSRIRDKLINISNEIQDLIVETSSDSPPTEEISRSEISQHLNSARITFPSV